MPNKIDQTSKKIVDREMLMQLKVCEGCGRKFNLGERVVLACGAWEGPPQWIHEDDTVFDAQSNRYVERKCFEANR
jgi:hypothetical protein